MQTPPRLGSYALLRPVGRGATGAVYEGRSPDGEAVAIKLVHAADHAHDVRRELLTHAGLHHPHLVELLDTGDTPPEGVADLPGDAPFLVLEWSAGTLAQRVEEAHTLEVLDHLLAGLAHLHGRGLVHGDLKPSNVLRIAGGDRVERWVLADFGIAHASGTQPLGGTLRYLAPECFGAGARPGPAADLYAVGVIGWMLATGSGPRTAARPEDWARVHRSEPLAPFVPVHPLPAGLEGWLRQLLSPSPSSRFARAADARHALHGLAAGPASPSAPLGGERTVFTTDLVADSTPSTLGLPSEATGPADLGSSAPPPRPFPGRAEIEAFRPRWRARTTSLVALRRPRFVGRQDALEVLWEELERVAREPRRVRLVAPPGMGATRLLDTFAVRAEELGAAVRVDALGRTGGLVAGLRRALHLDGIADEALPAALAAALPGLPRAERGGLVLELTGGGRASDAAWQGALERIAAGRRLLWVLDDALSHPGDRRRLARMTLLGVLRVEVAPEPEPPDAERVVSLDPLGRQHATELVESLLPLAVGTLAPLVDAAQGHPATAVALAVASVGDHGVVDVGRVAKVPADRATLDRARTVAERHGADPRRLTEAAALHAPTPGIFRAVFAGDDAAMVALGREGLLRPEGGTLWVQPMLVAAARNELGVEELLTVVRRLGERAPRATRAWHLAAAGYHQEAARAWLEEASELANHAHVHRQLAALDAAERSLQALPASAEGWSQLWQLRAHGLTIRGDTDGAAAAADKARTTASNPAERLQAFRRLAVCRSRVADLPGAIGWLEQAVAEPAPPELLTLANLDLAALCVRQGDVARGDRLLSAIDPAHVRPAARPSLSIARKQVDVMLERPLEPALARLDAAAAEPVEHPHWLGSVHSERGELLRRLGRYEEAAAALALAETYLAQAGAVSPSLVATLNRAMLLLVQGDAPPPSMLAEVVQTARRRKLGMLLIGALAVRALAHVQRGQLPAARADLQELASQASRAKARPDQDVDNALEEIVRAAPELAPEVDNARKTWSATPR